MRPAPQSEEIRFSVETMMHESPFALHKFWPHLHANSLDTAAAMLGNCPEGLDIMPLEVFQRP
jgi:hypothetical protein